MSLTISTDKLYSDYYEKRLLGRFPDVQVWEGDHLHIKRVLEFVAFKFPGAFDFGMTFLDLGSRDGWACELVYKAYLAEKAIGIEILPHYVDYWQKFGRSIEQGDLCDLSRFSTDEFDFVFCRHALNMVCDPVLALKEMYRVTKPGKLICIILEIPGNVKFHYVMIEKSKKVREWVKLAKFQGKWEFFQINPKRQDSKEYLMIYRKGYA